MVHVDHLNRPVKMADAGKATVWDAVWAPWGNVYSITGTAILDARLPGQWYQLESGLHYNWHRHYDPTLGRYTQPDPLGFVDGPSVYGYAGGSPLRHVDRDGRFAGVAGGAVIGLGFGVGVGIVYNWAHQNWTPKPKSQTYCPTRTAPETCSQYEHDSRQDEINRSCKPKPPRCTSPDAAKAAQARFCAVIRTQQITRCFKISGGDHGHWAEIADWWALYASCQ